MAGSSPTAWLCRKYLLKRPTANAKSASISERDSAIGGSDLLCRLGSEGSRFKPDYYKWNGGIASPVSEDVMEFTLVVGDTAGHILLHRLCR